MQAKSDVGGRWIAGQSDVETDYRREVDTDYRREGVDSDYRRDLVGSVHSEARGRDGGRRDGAAPPSIYQQAASLGRREVEISQVIQIGVEGYRDGWIDELIDRWIDVERNRWIYVKRDRWIDVERNTWIDG